MDELDEMLGLKRGKKVRKSNTIPAFPGVEFTDEEMAEISEVKKLRKERDRLKNLKERGEK